jgi:hypothetical protein
MTGLVADGELAAGFGRRQDLPAAVHEIHPGATPQPDRAKETSEPDRRGVKLAHHDARGVTAPVVNRHEQVDRVPAVVRDEVGDRRSPDRKDLVQGVPQHGVGRRGRGAYGLLRDEVAVCIEDDDGPHDVRVQNGRAQCRELRTDVFVRQVHPGTCRDALEQLEVGAQVVVDVAREARREQLALFGQPSAQGAQAGPARSTQRGQRAEHPDGNENDDPHLQAAPAFGRLGMWVHGRLRCRLRAMSSNSSAGPS